MGGSDLVGALVRNAGEQRPNLALAIATVAAQRPDGRELAGLRPPRDRLGVDPEHRRDLGRRKQRLGVGRTSAHDVFSFFVAATAVATRAAMLPFSVACPIWLGRAILSVGRTSPSRTGIASPRR